MRPSLPILTQAFGMTVVAGAVWAPASGRTTPRRRTPPAAAPVFRKSRRERSMRGGMSRSLLLPGRLVDGGADPGIGPAAADVARHRGVDVRVGRSRLGRQQRGRAH